MRAVAKPMPLSVMRNVYLRPTMSPTRPNTKAPNGRIRNPAVNVPPRLAAVCVLERRLGAVLDPELRKEMLYVEFHRVIGQTEPLGDLRVGQASGDEGPDLALARRQITWSAGTTFDPAPRRLRE